MAEVLGHALAPVRPVPRAGTLRRYGAFGLALYLLATSKWGSYLLPGPPYIADVVLAILLADRAVAALTPTRIRRDGPLQLTAGLLLLWSALLLALQPVDESALRDAAPYLYALVVFLVPPTTQETRDRAGRWITTALVFHAAWVTVALVAPGFVDGMPLLGGEITIFHTRNDFDGMVCGALAALALHRALAGRLPALNLALAAWGAALAVSAQSRAAVLALLAMLVVTVALAPARNRFRADARVAVAAILLALPVLSVGAVNSSGVERLVAGLEGYLPYVPKHGDVGAAQGTARARRQSWQVVRRWLEADTQRNVRGVGFGPDFLHDSGGDRLLLGGVNEEVRSPHNYFLNTWARLGLVGLALTVIVLLIGLRLAREVARRAPAVADVDVLAVLLIVGIPAAAAVGVVLESPFGALPYFWALGHLALRARELRSADERAA